MVPLPTQSAATLRSGLAGTMFIPVSIDSAGGAATTAMRRTADRDDERGNTGGTKTLQIDVHIILAKLD